MTAHLTGFWYVARVLGRPVLERFLSEPFLIIFDFPENPLRNA
jgi:hypothetical protein